LHHKTYMSVNSMPVGRMYIGSQSIALEGNR
jgi:hypothetical protein